MLDQNSPVTVTNVFLYNHPPNFTEMTAIKDRVFISTRGPESVAGWTNGERAENTEHAVAVSLSSAGSGLLPPLLLLGLWGFAAA
ncbi:hypothetical protein TcBrA4_0115960 [Trypanosoma cruzi]|nr:hypothetical protein TcBrA4_0115960 [Trypanosoma cruzi]